MYTFNRISRYLAIIILAGMTNLAALAQVVVKWERELSSDILWQEVTALGNLIVSSDNQLAGINTETGELLWSKQELAGLNRIAYNEVSNSPFFTVDLGSSILVLEQLSGDLVFDSQKAGIRTINDYFLLYNSDAILVTGESAGGEPIMVSVKMSNATVSWAMNEKFGRIIAATELGNDELLIVTLFNNYKLNAGNGDIIWKEANSPEAAQVEKLGVLGDFMKAAAESMTEDMEIELRYYKPEGSNVFYLGSQQESQSGFTSQKLTCSTIKPRPGYGVKKVKEFL
jgi:outer membrane protein assembly factor BamB